MSAYSEDTSPEMEAEWIRITRRLTPDQRLRQTFRLIGMARNLAMSGVRSRYPNASPEELRRRFAALVLDAETVRRVYGWDPEKEGY